MLREVILHGFGDCVSIESSAVVASELLLNDVLLSVSEDVYLVFNILIRDYTPSYHIAI